MRAIPDPRVVEAIRDRLARELTKETGSFFAGVVLDRISEALADTAANSPWLMTHTAASERIERHAARERQHLSRAAAAETALDRFRLNVSRTLSDPEMVRDRDQAERLAAACHVLLIPLDEP